MGGRDPTIEISGSAPKSTKYCKLRGLTAMGCTKYGKLRGLSSLGSTKHRKLRGLSNLGCTKYCKLRGLSSLGCTKCCKLHASSSLGCTDYGAWEAQRTPNRQIFFFCQDPGNRRIKKQKNGHAIFAMINLMEISIFCLSGLLVMGP